MRGTALLVAIASAGLLIAACGGGSDGGGRDERAIRERVEAAGEILFGDDVALTRFPEFVAEGCLQDDYLSDLLITQAFLGTLVEDDANVGLEVISVEFIADDRALVKGLLTIDGRPADEVFGGSDDDEPGLWVRENGEWRSADDCALYGTAGDE